MDLIKRGIAQSASSLSFWATSNDHRVRNKTIQLGSSLGCPTEDSLELLNCLSGLNAKIIVGRQSSIRTDIFDTAPFRPVLNKALTAGDFSIDVPFLTGFLENEIVYVAKSWASDLATTIPDLMMEIKENLPTFLVRFLTLNPETPPSELEPLARAMGNFYWNGNNDTFPTYNNVLSVLKALSDIFLTYSVYREAQITVSDSYTYFFNYSSRFDAEPLYGTTHVDELKYFFPNGTFDIRSEGSDQDRDVSLLLVNMWTDFADGRNPNPNLDWKGTSAQGGYLEISKFGLNLVNVANESTEMAERLKFWANLLHQSIGKVVQRFTENK